MDFLDKKISNGFEQAMQSIFDYPEINKKAMINDIKQNNLIYNLRFHKPIMS